MITLKEGLKLAIKKKACKGNTEAFKRALEKGNTLECYQIALGNKPWLIRRNIINIADLPELEMLANGVGKIYHDNGRLMSIDNIKNNRPNGLYELWNDGGQMITRTNYKDGKFHGLREKWDSDGKLYCRLNYEKGEIK